MTFEEKITQSIFLKSTIQTLKNLYLSHEVKAEIKVYDMNFRLSINYNEDTKYINYELLCKDEHGYFYKPVGYYYGIDGRHLGFGVTLIFYMVKEFFYNYHSLKQEGKLEVTQEGKIAETTIEVEEFKIEEDIIIGAMSRNAFINAGNLFDNNQKTISFQENGLDFSIEKSKDNKTAILYVITTDGQKHDVVKYENIDGGLKYDIINFQRQANWLIYLSLLDTLKADLDQ